MSAWRTLNERIYRLLLLLFPHGFRRVYGDEMAAVFRHRWERSRFPKWGRVWALSIIDAARVLPFEWASAAGELWHEMRETRWTSVPASLLADISFGVRSLIRKPGHLAVATLSLALGIGFNIVMFAVVNGLMLRPLPFAGADRLAYVVKRHNTEGWMTSPDREVVRALAENEELFETVEPYSSSGLILQGGAEPRVVSTLAVSETFMSSFGLTPLLGRVFRPGDAAATERSVVLSENLWRSAFGEDRGIIGEQVHLGGESYVVLGVVASNFNLAMTGTPDAWRLRDEDSGHIAVLARLTPGTSVEGATAGANAIANGLEEQQGGLSRDDWSEMVVPPLTFLGTDFSRTLWTLLAAVGVVLLIACSNLANMMLAKGLGRLQELGIRRALGASRFRVIRLFMMESTILSLVGGGVGLGLAYWGLAGVRQIRPAYVSAMDFVAIGPRIWVAALVVSMLAALLFGMLPTLRLASIDFNPALRAGSRFSSGTAGDRRARRALVVAEVALVLPLTIAAALMARTVYQSTHQDFGVKLDGFVEALVTIPDEGYEDEQVRRAFWADVQEQTAAIPGVAEVLVTNFSPPRFGINFGEPEVEGLELQGTPEEMTWQASAPAGYFELAGTGVLQGRAFSPGDEDESVVVVNEAFARRLGTGIDPIGTRMRFAGGDEWRTIVGVVENVVNQNAPEGARQLQVYLPTSGNTGHLARILMKTDAPLATLLPLLKERLWSLDPNVPVRDLREVRQSFMDIFGRQRFAATLFASFGIVGLILAAAGIHGVVSLSVNQRLPELGVRMVFGAKTSDVARAVFTEGLTPVVIGAVIGMVATVWVTRLIPGNLIDRSPADPLLAVLLTTTLMIVAVAACLGPVWRAVRLDPVAVLRSE